MCDKFTAQAAWRDVVIFETFNEGEEVTKPSSAKVTQQWMVNPGEDGNHPAAAKALLKTMGGVTWTAGRSRRSHDLPRAGR